MPIASPFTVNGLTVDGNLTVNDDGSGTYGKVMAGPTSTPMMSLQAATGASGFALQNATPSILTWTAPNDGLMHRFVLVSTQDVTSAETGGLVTIQYVAPDGTTGGPHTIYPGGSGTGETQPSATYAKMIKANTTVTIAQGSALTVGAAVVYAEIWGS